MSEISSYEAQVKKMQGLCEEHNLVYRFRKERYPMTFTIKPSRAMDAQMSMRENAEDEGYISPEASMTWIFNDGVLETKVRGGTFTISKTTRTKIENILIKMITFWQQYFFRCVIENGSLSSNAMPTIRDEELWPEDAEQYGDDDSDEDTNESGCDGDAECDGDDGDGSSDSTNEDTAEEDENAENENAEGDSENAALDGGSASSDHDTSESSGIPVSLDDPEVKEAARIVRAANKASCALLQRQMGIRASKAQRLLEILEALGVVGPFNGFRPREVLPYDEPDDDAETQYDEA